MRKWAFFVVAAAVAVIGCAGNGDSGGTATGGGTTVTTTGTDLRVSIPTPPGFTRPPGFLEFGFLTGQGRAIGDLTLVVDRLSVSDEWGEVRSDLNARMDLALGSYTFLTTRLRVDFEQGQHSRFFESYTLDPSEMIEDLGGSFRSINCFGLLQGDGSFSRAWPPNPIPLQARVFAGRSTLVPIFIDDSMFSMQQDPTPPPGDPCGGAIAVFDEQRFLDLNQAPIKGYINDYVAFDISAMPASMRPQLSAQSGSQSATRIFVSGDNYAVAPAGDSGAFELLTQFSSDPITGTFRVPSQLPGATTPGTFTLTQLDPTDLFNLREIVAVQGIWRQHQSVLAGFSTWNMVSFPGSSDGFEQEVVMFKKDGNGQIVDLLFGYLNFDLDEIRLYPIRGIVTGSFDPDEEVIVSITGQFDRNGNPTVAPQETRTGTFNVTTSGALPGDAPQSGTFLVFRV